ncbi:hypothetical protein NS263_00770 [Curtobacterium oceanosedimentum]|uniref:Gram-positive cocci surface proteins LPxTG domain-containing protein n=1 Tax=Curtobacterium oceanosedimentum TaxID=465820 RepID=A0ABR5SBB7_9MICO|nr:hypothetical protein [Curtobacterium oceanosedimentum]KTR43077.1 hypothetical protein NS263_00770 [Curtobacterium oceanosedimentum]
MHRSTSSTRRACALGTTVALIGLTTGLGVFTSTAAFAADEPTSAVAPADTSSTNAPSSATDTTGTDTTAKDASGTATQTDATTTPATTGTTTDATTAPATTDATAPAPTTASPAPSTTTKDAPTASSSVTVVGSPKVGTTLFYKTTGVDDPRAVWTVEGAAPFVASSFEVTAAMIGKTVTVTVTGSAPGQTATATTDAVTEDVAFATETSYDAPRTIELTAGDTLDEVFGVSKGSGPVTYSIGYADPESVDPETDTPESYLPDDTTFDAATATLSGRVTVASVFDFTVVATNGTSTATEYVEVVVEPAKAVGVMAQTVNTSPTDLFDGEHPFTGWLIEPDGHVTTFKFPGDPDQEPTVTDGGQPTVQQGQSLWINGSPVDEFGNDTTRYDDEGNADPVTVTSDHATDQIAFDEDSYSTKVTFPHASTHVLTVAAQSVSVSFPVTVVPTAAPASTVGSVTPTVATAPKGQLAFTGADETAPIAWALGLIAAGAGLAGVRSLRRRRAQR